MTCLFENLLPPLHKLELNTLQNEVLPRVAEPQLSVET